MLERRPGLGQFTNDVVTGPDVRALVEKIEFVVDDDAEAAGYHKMPTIIDIALDDGRKISGRADFGKGSPAMPMSYDDVADKFTECAEYAGFGSVAHDVVAMVRDLETLPTIARLTAPLAGRP